MVYKNFAVQIAFFLFCGATACVTPSTQPELKIKAEIPEFDADKWEGIDKDVTCISYLYEGDVNPDGNITNWKEIYSTDNIFKNATESSLSKWKLEEPTQSKIYADIFYTREGQTHLEFPKPDEVSTLVEIRKKFAANMVGKMTNEKEKSEKLNPAIKRKDMDIPYESLDRRINGRMIIKFDVNEEGNTENVRVLVSSPQGVFDKAAEKALRSWKYEKGKPHNGREVAMEVRVDGTKPGGCYYLYNLQRNRSSGQLKISKE